MFHIIYHVTQLDRLADGDVVYDLGLIHQTTSSLCEKAWIDEILISHLWSSTGLFLGPVTFKLTCRSWASQPGSNKPMFCSTWILKMPAVYLLIRQVVLRWPLQTVRGYKLASFALNSQISFVFWPFVCLVIRIWYRDYLSPFACILAHYSGVGTWISPLLHRGILFAYMVLITIDMQLWDTSLPELRWLRTDSCSCNADLKLNPGVLLDWQIRLCKRLCF